jgi:hypothetical protein
MATRRQLSRRKQSRRRRQQQKGGEFNMPISKFYQLNDYNNDPQRMAVTGQRMAVTGGSRRRKNYSRKYLRGGNFGGFFGNFATATAANNNASAVTGNYAPVSMPTRFMV